MEPPQPPLPSARNLPFHPLIGSQTSIPISESEVGFRVAATRQKAGNPGKGVVLPVGEKVPVSIVLASVIERVGETSFKRLSQDCAGSAAGARVTTRTIVERIGLAAMTGSISGAVSPGERMLLLSLLCIRWQQVASEEGSCWPPVTITA